MIARELEIIILMINNKIYNINQKRQKSETVIITIG